MIRQARFFLAALALAATIGASIGGSLFLLNQINAVERRNDEVHALAQTHRDRLDSENKASIRDRQRIADQLRRIEVTLERQGLLSPGSGCQR